MLRARRRIFERGLYAPLAEAVAERVVREPISPGFTVLDAGCGEGYYVGRAARAIAERAPDEACCSIGVDVSKDALRLAARAYRDVCFVVNDVKHRLTVADACVDVLLDVFAPRNAAEFARVVRDGGLLVVVIPGAGHLQELRGRLPLLGIEPGKRERAIARLGAAFRLESEQAVEYRRELEAEDVLDLLRMTPNAWHLDAADVDPVTSWRRADVTFAMQVLAFRRGG
ncbi:MAG TPA: methyltransferase domain-containing protein [Gammaproteobacteria bacterium]